LAATNVNYEARYDFPYEEYLSTTLCREVWTNPRFGEYLV